MTLVGLIAIVALCASVVIALAALVLGSWQLMWASAILSLAFSIVTGLSIGALTFLLTTLQFMAAVGMRWSVGRREWAGLLAIGILLWVGLVPVQLFFGVVWLPWLLAFPLVALLCTAALISRSPLWSRAA